MTEATAFLNQYEPLGSGVFPRFWESWFGIHAGRELGCPERWFTDNSADLERHVDNCRRNRLPCYMSVQPFTSRDQPFGLEKLFWDFDCEQDPSKAWIEAKSFAEALVRFYHVKPLLVFSGRKGYHLYTFLRRTVQFPLHRTEFVKAILEELQKRLLKGLEFETLDPAVIGDLKRLARIPYSIHEKSGLLCQPVGLDGQPLTPEELDLEEYRRSGLDTEILEHVIKAVVERQRLKETHTKKLQVNAKKYAARGIRPCIQHVLTVPLEHGEGHQMRLAIAAEYLNHGYTVDQIVPLFSSQADFNEARTRYFVEYMAKRGYKPFKCRTIQELGFCLEDCPRLHLRRKKP